MRKLVWRKETAALLCPPGFLLLPGREDDEEVAGDGNSL